jgi:hypothetical protein
VVGTDGLYKLNQETLSFDLIKFSMLGNYNPGNYIAIYCQDFTDYRRYVSSGRCIFSGSRYALSIDFKKLDEVDVTESVSSRRILFTPRKKYGASRLYNRKKPVFFENDLVLVSIHQKTNT